MHVTATQVFVEFRSCWISFHESHDMQQQLSLTNCRSCIIKSKINQYISKFIEKSCNIKTFLDHLLVSILHQLYQIYSFSIKRYFNTCGIS